MAPRIRRGDRILCAVALLVGPGCGSSSVSSVTSPSTVQRCQTTVSAPTAAFGPNGGTGTATVGAPRECSWTASTQASWIRSSRRHPAKATAASRFGWRRTPIRSPGNRTVAVSDRSLELSQEAAPCSFVVSPNTDVVGAEGGTLTIDVRTNAACSWTASTDAPWATPSPESGKGALTVRLAVAPNSGPERSARATIASQQLTFSQRSPAPPAPALQLPARHQLRTARPPLRHRRLRHRRLRHHPLRHRPRRHRRSGTAAPAPPPRHRQLRRHRLRHLQLRRRSRSPAKSSRVRGCVPT